MRENLEYLEKYKWRKLYIEPNSVNNFKKKKEMQIVDVELHQIWIMLRYKVKWEKWVRILDWLDFLKLLTKNSITE
jgi:hypothetical protein